MGSAMTSLLVKHGEEKKNVSEDMSIMEGIAHL